MRAPLGSESSSISGVKVERIEKKRPVALAGRLLLAILLLAGATCVLAANPDVRELLQHADDIKTSDNSAFLDLLKQLDAQADEMPVPQRDYLDYLKGWQLGYRGDYPAAEPALTALLTRTKDPTLRTRVRISLLNDQALASHYNEAYANLSELLEALPQVQDKKARNFTLGVAAVLYNQAGQYDLALKYAELWLADDTDGSGACKATTQKIETLYKTGKLRVDDAIALSGIDACKRIGDPLFANQIRVYLASAELDAGHAGEALKMLEANNADIVRTHSASIISAFHSTMARAYLYAGDLTNAAEFANSAIRYGIKEAYSKNVADAYQTLYEVAKRQENFASALNFYEKYATADKGYLNDTSARTLAYQMVNQQVLDKKRQIDALNEKNQVLLLQQKVDTKSAETKRLYILLLLSGIAFIALWAYKTKRSQLHFMKLARRDGLTGIFNRQHFIEAANDLLRYCEKSSREACVVVIDLDHFKLVNDAHGHAAGDLVLKRAVKDCQMYLRSIDVFGRLGGEEFGVVLPDCALEQAQRLAEQLRSAIAAVSDSDAGIDFPISASFGIAAARESGYDLRELMANADSALYEAKREGRNRIATYRVIVTPVQMPQAAIAS
jgi:diguanylate cyclase (GGDEF)-like protein